MTFITEPMPFHFITRLWQHLSGLGILFMVITFKKLCGLPTSEKSCGHGNKINGFSYPPTSFFWLWLPFLFIGQRSRDHMITKGHHMSSLLPHAHAALAN